MKQRIKESGYKNLKPIKGKILENIKQSKNSIYLTNEKDILFEINNMIGGLSMNTNIYIGIINDCCALKIYNDTGLIVKDFRICYNKSDIIHWYNRHVLNKSNMTPMKVDDILKFIDLLSNYSKIEARIDNSAFKIIFSGEIGGILTSISIISAGKNRISFKTMYYSKKPLKDGFC